MKSVEMQVAIPRTVDASKIQQQMTNHHRHFQDSLAQHLLNKQLRNRKQVNEYTNTRGVLDTKDEEAGDNLQRRHDESLEREKEARQLNHPYLGNQFDRSR